MSSAKINLNILKPSKIKLSDNLTRFNCDYEDDLGCNDFIHKEDEAKLFQKERHGITYLFSYNRVVVAFVTLAMSSIEAKRIDKRYKKPIRLKSYPSLLIGRLAVDNKFRKKGIGKYLCKWCIGFAIRLSDEVGCRYVILETNEKKVNFYKKCEFEKGIELDTDTGRKIWMYQRIAIMD